MTCKEVSLVVTSGICFHFLYTGSVHMYADVMIAVQNAQQILEQLPAKTAESI